MADILDTRPHDVRASSIAHFVPPPERFGSILDPYAMLQIPTGSRSPQESEPKHPRFATLEARIKSFDHPMWPSTWCPVKPEDLAQAGFYYFGTFEGIDDSVKCFHCDKGLCLWQPGDVPFDEHLRVNPNCKYVLEFHPRFKKAREFQEQEMAELSTKNPDDIINDWMEGLMVQLFFKDYPRMGVEVMRKVLYNQWVEFKRPFGTYQKLKEAVERYISQTIRNTEHELSPKLSDPRKINGSVSQSSGVGSASSLSSSPEDCSLPSMVESDEESGISSQESCSSQQSSASSTESGVFFSSQVSSDEETRDTRLLCKVCLCHDLEVTFVPCGHFISCSACSEKCDKCPYCRRKIREKFRTYIS